VSAFTLFSAQLGLLVWATLLSAQKAVDAPAVPAVICNLSFLLLSPLQQLVLPLLLPLAQLLPELSSLSEERAA
jgi:hypothetical protein